MTYAKHILDLLAEKHSKDVFIAECKDGPTQSVSEHLRMDAWVMNRSWAHPCYTAYEIKVSRSDFLSDKKWRHYLPYCNEFFFVAPKGLIGTNELPPEAGLLELLGGANGKRLVRRKATQWRDVEVPESLFRYVLMCRVIVGRSEFHVERPKSEELAFWQRFCEEKTEKRELGYQVGKAIRDKVENVKRENERLEKRITEYEDIRQWLAQIGIDPNGYASRWTVKERMKAQEDLFPRDVVWTIKYLRDHLNDALKKLEPKKEDEQAA